MNRDDIIRMAQEAGYVYHVSGGTGTYVQFYWDQLEQFANLVAAAEREAFDAKYPIQLTHDQYNVVINAALKDEREACAKVCEQPIDEIQITDDCSEYRYRDNQECADTIRARGA